MDNLDEMVKLYEELGSFQKVADRYNLTPQRVHQKIGHLVSKNKREDIDPKILEAFIENEGHYSHTAEEMDVGYSTVKRVVEQNLSEAEVAALVEKRRTEPPHPVTKLFQVYEDQRAYLEGLEEVSIMEFIRNGLEKLLADPDCKTKVQNDILLPHSAEGKLSDKIVKACLTKEMGQELGRLKTELGRGSISAALRQAVEAERQAKSGTGSSQ